MTWHNMMEISWHTIMEIEWHSIQEIRWHNMMEIRHPALVSSIDLIKSALIYVDLSD
jgi:hypothetical protein